MLNTNTCSIFYFENLFMPLFCCFNFFQNFFNSITCNWPQNSENDLDLQFELESDTLGFLFCWIWCCVIYCHHLGLKVIFDSSGAHIPTNRNVFWNRVRLVQKLLNIFTWSSATCCQHWLQNSFGAHACWNVVDSL